MLYSYKYSFELTSYFIQLYDSKVIRVVFVKTKVQGKQKYLLFSHGLLFTDIDLKNVFRRYADKQLYLQKTHTSPLSFFLSTTLNYKT